MGAVMIKDLIKRCIKLPQPHPKLLPGNEKTRDLPLDPDSPWPKFRGNALQNGRSKVKPAISNALPWEYQTGKGIFSSPVIDGEGTIYIGSADHYFYAITPQGELKWRFATKEIIDSAALLDDRQRVYFGSGDGHVYCLDRNRGTQIWKFKAHSTQAVEALFNIKTYNVNWFEGNIAMLRDGTILAPNDNYLVYGIDRDTGKGSARFLSNEMIWSCPAVNTDTDQVFFGSCFIAAINFFCFNAGTGEKIWTSGGLGTISASSLLTSNDPDAAVIVGGFDGILRALSQKNGKQLWSFGSRDHIYGSPAQLSCGTIVQASCDGTVYGLNPSTGKPVWWFDTREPIRSSPAVDADDQIYFGSGEGRLYCLNKDGSFRWAYTCIDEDRNDLNSSPALGNQGICIAGENGKIFFIPYDYPLTQAGQKDTRSVLAAEIALPKAGSHFFYVNTFGRLREQLPETIDANDPVMLTHMVRSDNKTCLSAIDIKSLKVSCNSDRQPGINVSANRQFITLIPKETWTGPEGGLIDIHIHCRFKTRLKRLGLKFFGGSKTDYHKSRFTFQVAPYREIKNGPDNLPMPYAIPRNPSDPATVFEISRLSCPSPTMLPSYNQIGFDSLHYLAVIVEGKDSHAVLWVIPGRLDETTGKTVVNPELNDIYVLNMAYENGLLTLYQYEGFMLSFVGSWDMPFESYRIASRVDPATGQILKKGAFNVVAQCDKIKMYGKFLKLMGMSDMKTGLMHICGGLNLDLWHTTQVPEGCADLCVDLNISPAAVTARLFNCPLKKQDHLFGILLINAHTSRPIAANYARRTTVETDTRGYVRHIRLNLGKKKLSGMIRAYVMVDFHAVFKDEIHVAR